jgi:CRP/FNR family transcriptional regulator, cyclic AMP receptor protein
MATQASSGTTDSTNSDLRSRVNDVRRAIASGVLASVSADTVGALFAAGTFVEAVPRTSLFTPGTDEDDVAFLVLSGLARRYLVTRSGRELTINYARPGTILGVNRILGVHFPSHSETVSASRLLVFSATMAAELAQREVALALAFAQQLAEAQRELIHVITLTAMGTVKQRVARLLLDVAVARNEKSAGMGDAVVMLTAPVTQQSIAQSIGSVREVVARTLHEFRAAGVIQTTSQGVRILDPQSLAEEAAFGE